MSNTKISPISASNTMSLKAAYTTGSNYPKQPIDNIRRQTSIFGKSTLWKEP
jgi:hypothetical protein